MNDFLQLSVVLLWTFILVFSIPFCVLSYFYLLIFTQYWWLAIAYSIWLLKFKKIPRIFKNVNIFLL